MGEIKVTSAQLRSKKDELELLNKKFAETIGKLESTVQTLASAWEGESHDVYYNAFQKDKGQMDVFTDTVRNFAAVLDMIIARYESAEQKSAAIAAGHR